MSIRDPKPKYEQPAGTFNRPTTIEIIKQLRDAGLDAWDSTPDPEAYLQEMRGYRQAEIDRLTAELQQANLANAELRKLLEECEWARESQIGEETWCGACPCCDANDYDKHKPTCPLGRALNRPECGETTDGT